jgi:Dockerin type I domain
MVSDANGNPTSNVVFHQNSAFNYGGNGYTFSLSTMGFAPGVYNLTVYGDAFAAQQVQFTLHAVPGDVNGDGVVNCADLAIIKASFGKKKGQPGYDPRADVNRDGVVNVIDLAFVARQLPAGTSCK